MMMSISRYGSFYSYLLTRINRWRLVKAVGKNKTCISFLVIALCCINTCFAEAPTAQSIHVSSAQSTFTVQLPANPSTGYQWALSNYDKSLLILKSKTYIRPQSNLIGAGGVSVFTFELRAGKSYPKNTAILFNYLRSWAPETASPTEVTVFFD